MKNIKDEIYVNGRFLCHKMDGIGRFSLEICKQLKRLKLDFTIVVPKGLNYKNEFGFEIVEFGHLKSHFWEQIDLLLFLKSNGSPLLLNLSGLGPLFYKNQIITIHDLSFYENKKWFSKAYTLFYSTATPVLARNAKKILTVSNFSKSEIIKHLKIDAGKIEVIYNAVANDLKRGVENVTGSSTVGSILNSKYILAVSSIDPRKNLQCLIDAFLALQLEDYKLVLVGKTSSHFNVRLQSNSDNIIFTGFVSDADLSNLYKKCEFFIYASLYEGFGIPPLEAMKNSCAVIVSDIPSLKEVCSDAALYVDPYDVESVKNGMVKIISDSKLKEALKSKGSLRSSFFKWEKSGDKVYEIIKNSID
jgi:glycosyltransferase involved in cell wall biosynthesis